MAWEKTTFERQALYEEIWAEPMTTVAQRYALSDVGLKKICVKLDIPVPPRGYWARLKAGQLPEKPPLPKSDGPSTFERSWRVDEPNKELENRLANARLEEAPLPLLSGATYSAPSGLADLGKEATSIAKAMAKFKEVDGLVSLSDKSWAEISVSEGSRVRALMLLDKVAFTIKAAAGVFHAKAITQVERPYHSRRDSDEGRGSFEIHGTRYFVRIKERILKEEIIEPPPLSPKKRSTRYAYEPDFSAFYRPKKYSFTPTGKLQLQIYRASFSYEIAKTEDTANTVVEDKIFTLIEKVEKIALTAKVEEQLRHERKLESERKSKIWQARKANKDKLLKELDEYEQMARDLDRAESLRRLMEKIRGLPESQSEPKEKHIAQLTLMADWLDPIVGRPWPKVDDVPDNNPHSSW
jgi:hypothetical protein